MLSVNVSDIAVIIVKNVDYRCIIHNISKFEAINLLKNSVLGDRGYFLFSIYKMVDNIDNCKFLNINIGTIMKNTEMLKVVPDHFKT